MPASTSSRQFSGYSDLPTSQDALGMADRYKGLARFICECETPMTIAINGDWGSGKSSAMQIIQENLKERAGESISDQIIKFNTWEFSIVCDNSKLVFELLQTLNEQLMNLEKACHISPDGEKAEKVSRILSTLSVVGGALKELSIRVLEESDAKYFFSLFKGVSESRTPAGETAESIVYTSPTKLLREVSESISERISRIVSKIQEDGREIARLFIFIDDLDRLDPRIALELIEGMKNFASFQNCVFILAVDQNVVERGLKSKYGDEISDEMAQHFFDKIIQLPFRLPVNAYRLSDYVTSLLETNSIAADSGIARSMAEKLALLLKKFGITNPRTIKRSFNMLQMYRCMDEESSAGGAGADSLPSEELVDRYCKQYAVLLLMLTSPEDHAKMAQLVDSGCSYTDDGDLRQVQAEFQALQRGKDDEVYSIYIAAVLDAFYTEDGDDLRATKELVDALTFTRSDDVDHVNYASAKFLLKLFPALESCPENTAVGACGEWQDIKAHASTPYVLSQRTDDLRITLDGLAGGNKIIISRFPNSSERFKRFFITLFSRQITRELLEGLSCFHILEEGAGFSEDANVFNCYFTPGRTTIFITGTKNMDKILQLMQSCGFFGDVKLF